jgi:multidrug efflux pump subunit AcrA (membrane-fusion protein)
MSIVEFGIRLEGRDWKVLGDVDVDVPSFNIHVLEGAGERMEAEDGAAFIDSLEQIDKQRLVRAAAQAEADRLEAEYEAIAERAARARRRAGGGSSPWRFVSNGTGPSSFVSYNGERLDHIESAKLEVTARDMARMTLTVIRPRFDVQVKEGQVDMKDRVFALGRFGPTPLADLAKTATMELAAEASAESDLVVALLARQGGEVTVTSEELQLARQRIDAGQFTIGEPAEGLRQLRLDAPSLEPPASPSAPGPKLEVVAKPEPPPPPPAAPAYPDPPGDDRPKLSDEELGELL